MPVEPAHGVRLSRKAQPSGRPGGPTSAGARYALVAGVAAALALVVVGAAGWSAAGMGHSVTRGAALGQPMTSVPVTARGPLSAALGRADRSYRVVGMRARNREQGLNATFSGAGVSVASGAGHVRLRLLGYGYGDTFRPVVSVAPTVAANRVDYARGALKEWYANGPLGLEQTFDLSERPARGRGPLTLSLAITGNLRPRLGSRGIVLNGAGGALSYGGLSATDARGRVVRSWLELQSGRLLVRVDDRGAAYPLRIDPFVQQAKVTASDGAAGDFFAAAAISGNTLAVGAPRRRVGTHDSQGTVYVFERPPSGWANATQVALLTASDGAAFDGLGVGVSISGDTIVAGASSHAIGNAGSQGAAYVFVKPASGWTDATQTAELTASDGAAGDGFGGPISISGDTIVVGVGQHTVGTNFRQGEAYVFVKPASGWINATQTGRLLASDGAAGDGFATAVAVSDGTVAVGAPDHQVGLARQGAVYVFVKPLFGWRTQTTTQTAELTASDGATNDGFGIVVAASGDTVVASAIQHQVGANQAQGAAYQFTKPGDTWRDTTQAAELTASDGRAGEVLGVTLGVSGNVVVVGALSTVGANAAQGAVYLFGLPPTITIATPADSATFTQGQRVPASFSCTAPAGAMITGCAGPVAAGAPIDTAAVGRHSFTVNAIDSDGLSATKSVSYSVTRVTGPGAKPSITAFTQSASVWREGSKLARISSSRRRPVGTTFSFVLNQPAGVTLSFSMQLPGRKKGGGCVKPTGKNKRNPRCTRAIAAGTLALSGHRGLNRVRFEGRVSRTKRLNPGVYAVTMAATNAARQRTTSRRLSFKILK